MEREGKNKVTLMVTFVKKLGNCCNGECETALCSLRMGIFHETIAGTVVLNKKTPGDFRIFPETSRRIPNDWSGGEVDFSTSAQE